MAFSHCPRTASPVALALLLLAALAPLNGRAATAAAATNRAGFDGFTFRAWQTEAGLPQNNVSAMRQTSDGFLWLATENGLARFDGLRFRVFGLREGLRSLQVRTLLADRTGGLWVGTAGGGLTRMHEGRVRTFTRAEGLPGNSVTALAEGSDGTLWLGTGEGLCCLIGEVITVFTEPVLPKQPIRALARLRDDSLLIAVGDAGVYRLKGGFSEFPVPFPAAESRVAHAFLEDGEGRLWIGVGKGGLLCRTDGQWRTFTERDGLPPGYITTLLQDAGGIVWAGTLDAGLLWFDGQRFRPVTKRDGLSDDAIRSLLADREGNLWVGTRAGGLNRLSPKRFALYGAAAGLTNEYIRSLAESPDGTLWVATIGGGLYRGQAGRFTAFVPGGGPTDQDPYIEAVTATRAGSVWWGGAQGLFFWRDEKLPGAATSGIVGWLNAAGVLALLEDVQEGVWIGTMRGELRLYRGSKFVDEPRVSPNQALTCLAQAPDGTLWAGANGAGLFRVQPGAVTNFTTRHGLPSDMVRAVYLDEEGTVWIGTAGGGLSRFQNGRFASFTEQDGLGSDTISQILEDGLGHLWLGGNHGIERVPKRALHERADRGGPVLHPLALGQAEGMASEECSGGSSPACVRARDGLLYFATTRGVVAVDPRRPNLEPRGPTVTLEEVWLNGAVFTNRQPTRLRVGAAGGMAPELPTVTVPPGGRNLEFRYTALSLTAPERVRFRYRLEPLDPGWIEVGGRREAYYPHARPGEYIFRVAAAGGAGAGSESMAALGVIVQPRMRETLAFRVATGLFALAVVAWAVRAISQRVLKQRLARLEMQTAIERERARIARDLHDDLGANLTQITMLSELGRDAATDRAAAQQHFDRIAARSRGVVQSLEEIVWAVNPQNDNLARLAEYLCRFADECFDPSPIRCWQDVPAGLPHLPVRAEVRHNCYLVVKEAMNNVLKHSGATEVWFRLALDGREMRLTVEDNGHGFDPANTRELGNGLKNMRARVESVGGRLAVDAAPGRGTRVSFDFPLDTAAPASATGSRVASSAPSAQP